MIEKRNLKKNNGEILLYAKITKSTKSFNIFKSPSFRKTFKLCIGERDYENREVSRFEIIDEGGLLR